MNKKQIIYFLKFIGLFLFFTFIADKLVYGVMNFVSDKVFTGQSVGKINQFLQLKEDRYFFIFGSSRANHSLNPTAITANSFNMGTDGRAIAFSTALIKLLPSHKRQVVLLHVDPEKAFSKSYKGEDIDQLAIKYNRNNIIRKEINKINRNNPFQKFYWSLSYNNKVVGIFKNFFFPDYDVRYYNGFDPIFPTDEQRKIFANKLTQPSTQDCDSDLVLNAVFYNYLKEVSLFCRTNNKKLILFTSPLYRDVCKTDNRKMAAVLKSLGIAYFDLTDFYRSNNSLPYWKDEDHLSSMGAEVFTDSVKTLLSPYISEKNIKNQP